MKYTVITPDNTYTVDAKDTKHLINYLLEFEDNIADFGCLSIIRGDFQEKVNAQKESLK